MNKETVKDHMPKKHHFVPAFYLSRWERPNEDYKLIEYKNLGPHGLGVKEKKAESTGYERHLYSKRTAVPDVRDPSFEKSVMSKLDGDAAKVIPELLLGNVHLNKASKRTWSSFLYAQLLRGPVEKKTDAETRKSMWKRATSEQEDWYRNFRLPGMPETFADILSATPDHEHDGMFFDAFERAIYESPIIDSLMRLRWNVRKLLDAKFPLLTSDRPVFCNNRLQHYDGLIYLPLSPSAVFYAQPDTSKAHQVLDNGTDNKVARFCNKGMVEGANEYVWTNYEGHKRFVERWIGTNKRQSPSSIVEKAFKEMPDPIWDKLMSDKSSSKET